MICQQICPVYLKLPYLRKNVSERFSKIISEEVNRVFGSIRLKTILYTDRPLSEIYKDVSPNQKKNIVYKFSCNCSSDLCGKNISKVSQ